MAFHEDIVHSIPDKMQHVRRFTNGDSSAIGGNVLHRQNEFGLIATDLKISGKEVAS